MLCYVMKKIVIAYKPTHIDFTADYKLKHLV